MMYVNINSNEVKGIEKVKKMIYLYSDVTSVNEIVEDYINEIKDFSEKTDLFYFDLIPDKTYCKIEVVPKKDGKYIVNLNRYYDELNSEELKILDITNLIKYNLNKQKYIYLNEALSIIDENKNEIKKYISKFYETKKNTQNFSILDGNIIPSNKDIPFITISKNDTGYKKELQDLCNHLKIDIFPLERQNIQVKGLSEALLYKQFVTKIIEDRNKLDSNKEIYNNFLEELKK